MKLKPSLAVALVSVLSLSGCIHVQNRETKILQTSELPPLRQQTSPKKEMAFAYYAYRPAVYPLEAFTTNLMSGEFRTALSRVDFSYVPAQGDSQALAILLANNYIPVWLSVRNLSNRAVHPRETIILDTPGHALSPIDPSQLPQHFSKLNWNAVAANVYNFTVIAVVVAVALYAGNIPVPISHKNEKKPANEPFNPWLLSQEIRYETLMFSMLPLEPGESRSGLVIFGQDSSPDWTDISLRVIDNSRPVTK